MIPDSLPLLSLLVFGGSAMQAATGLGLALLVVPLIALVSVEYVPVPLVAASLATSWLMCWRGRRDVDWRHLDRLLVGAAAGIALAAWLVASATAALLAILFGALILAALALSLSGFRLPRSQGAAALTGVLSGFMGASAGAGTPLLALFYQDLAAPRLRATLATIQLIVGVGFVIGMALAGRFGAREVGLATHLLPGMLAGYLFGPRLASRIDGDRCRAAAYAISAVAAVVLVARGALALSH